MIVQITVENFSKIDPFLEEYLQNDKNTFTNPKEQIIISLKKRLEAKRLSIYAACSKNHEKIYAISGVDNVSGFMFLWHPEELALTLGNPLYELIQNGLEQLQKLSFKVIRMTTKSSTSITNSEISELGFRIYERAKMDLSRENFLQLSPPQPNQHLTFQKWSEEIKENLIPILVESHFNYNHPDGYVFSQYVGEDGCQNLMKDMEGHRFGQFSPDNSYGCFLDSRLIGGITFLNREDHGYISEIVLDSAFKGQHLGKLIMFNAIRKWFENNPESQQVDLDVTLKNRAPYNLYKSLGFQEQGRYAFYCWVDPSLPADT